MGTHSTAELVGKVGKLRASQIPNEHGLTLQIQIPSRQPHSWQRCTACALTADSTALAVTTDEGTVYAVHLSKQRYTQLDVLGTAGTSAAFMLRQSRRLFIGCCDGAIHCYDISSSARLAKLVPGHRTAVTSLSCKPDTEQLLSASADAVLLWDLQAYRQRRMLGHASHRLHAAFSSAGNVIAAVAAQGEVTTWNAKTLQVLSSLQIPCGQQDAQFSPSCLSISPDERWLLVGCRSPALLLLYNLEQRGLQHALLLPAEMFGVVQLQFLPDSCSAAVLTSNGCISFLDVQQCSFTCGPLQLSFPGYRASSFSTDARANVLAAVCSDGLLRVYDLGIVRGKQQQWPGQQVQRLGASQLAELPGAQHSSSSSTGMPLQVLANAGNVPATMGKPAGVTGKPAADKLQTQQLDKPAAALNKRKLREILLVYGEFPARYRQLIWDHLLLLPHNSSAFALLQDKGTHGAYKDLANQLSLPGKSRLVVRLQACISQLAFWCPLFGEAGFLPSFAFPFVKLLGPKAETSFELMATLLLNWCKGWFELFPNPPLPLLRRFVLLVCHHDQQLGSHLQQLGIPLLQYVWRHLSGAMSDALPEQSDWLVFWDHCLASAAGPGFLYQMLASYMIGQRQLLLAATDEQQLQRLFASRPTVDIHQLVKRAYMLDEQTPDYARVGLKRFAPLPATIYPVFNEYPAGSVELQQLERQRIQEAEEALIRRRQVVDELEQRSRQVAHDSAALAAQRKQLTELDAQRRAALRGIEDSLVTAGACLDDRSKQEKLKQIRLVDEAYQTTLSSLRAEWQAELAALKDEVKHKQRLTAAALKARQEEEDIKALEFQAQQRLWALQQEELAAAGSSALQDAAAAQALALAAEQRRVAAEWQAQDEARALKQQHEQARSSRLAAAAEQEAARQAAKGLLLAHELQSQEELLKLEHQRRLRQLAEDEAELTARQLQLLAERQTVAAAVEHHAIQAQAKACTQTFNETEQQRMAAVSEARDALMQHQAELHMAAAEIGTNAQLSTARQQLAEMQQLLQQADKEHADHVQQIFQQLRGETQSHAGMSTLQSVKGGNELQTAAEAAAAFSIAQPSEAPTKPSSLQSRIAAITQQLMAATAVAPAAAVRSTAEEQFTPAPAIGTIADSPASAQLQEQQSRAAQADRRAALEAAHGRELDQQLQQLHNNTQKAAGPGGSAVCAAAGVIGKGDSSAASQSSSLNVSVELEQLLAETEAELQREVTSWTAEQPSQLQAKVRARGATSSRLQAVHEEWAPGRAVGSPGAACGTTSSPATQPNPQGRGGITRASPVASTASSRSISVSARLSRRAAAAGVCSTPLRTSVELAAAGLEPLTSGGSHWVASRTAGLQSYGPTTSKSSSGASSNGSSLQQQQQQSAPHAAASSLGSPSSVLTSSSVTGTLTSSLDWPPAGRATGQAAIRAAAAAAEQADSSTCSLYEPVLLNVAGQQADGAATAAAMLMSASDAVLNPSSSSGHLGSTSKTSSLSFDMSLAAATKALAAQQTKSSGLAAVGADDDAAAEAAAADFSNRPGSGSRQHDTRSGLDAAGKVSSELRQSSSATSDQLEQLLQQISQYEDHLQEDSDVFAGAASDAASIDSSLSWSQTLTGLAQLLPKKTQ